MNKNIYDFIDIIIKSLVFLGLSMQIYKLYYGNKNICSTCILLVALGTGIRTVSDIIVAKTFTTEIFNTFIKTILLFIIFLLTIR